MRNIALALSLLLIITTVNLQCKSTRKFLETDVLEDNKEELPEIDIQYDNTLYGLCYGFTNAVSTNDLRHLDNYFPDAAVARQISTEDLTGLSDEELEERMIAPLRERLKANIDNIRKDATAKGLDHSIIIFHDHKVEPRQDATMPVDVVSVLIGSDQIEGSVPITVSEVGGKYYILEVLFSTDVFKN